MSNNLYMCMADISKELSNCGIYLITFIKSSVFANYHTEHFVLISKSKQKLECCHIIDKVMSIIAKHITGQKVMEPGFWYQFSSVLPLSHV